MARPPTPDLKQRLLDEGRALLVHDGWAGFSLRKLGRRVGVSQTAVYLHFASKDALVHALIDEGMQRLHARLERAAGPRDPRRRLERLCRAYLAFGLENREFYEIMFNLPPRHMQRYPPEMYRRAVRNLELFQETLAEAWGRNGARARDLRVAATSVWAALHGALTLLANQRVDFSLPEAEVIRACVRLALAVADGPR